MIIEINYFNVVITNHSISKSKNIQIYFIIFITFLNIK